MIRPEQIPGEVVEAAMKHTGWASEYERVMLVNHYRAVLAAALAAWPEAKWHEVQVPDDSDEVRYMLKKIGLILPLPKEGE